MPSAHSPVPEPTEPGVHLYAPDTVHFGPSGERVARLETRADNQDRRLDDHEKVLKAIQQHLGELVAKFDGFKRYLMFGAVLIFSGTSNGEKVVSLITKVFT